MAENKESTENVTVRLEAEPGTKEAFAIGVTHGYRQGVQDVLSMLVLLCLTAVLFRHLTGE